jgi:enamine deaminase RidA (YjgF/YER057c/UK114 family)
MSAVEDRLAELGHTVPNLVPPAAAYVPALRDGNHIYVSGQLPMVNGELPATGHVGAEVSTEKAAELAALCALNGIAAAKSVEPDLDKLNVVKVVGFVSSAPDFTAQPVVINGASELLGTAFGAPHARSAVGVAALPLNTPVEVEFIFRIND